MPKPIPYATCPNCGKRGYPNRDAAKRAARRSHPSERMSAYPCPLTPEGITPRWHIGHLPPTVKNGEDRRNIPPKKKG